MLSSSNVVIFIVKPESLPVSVSPVWNSPLNDLSSTQDSVVFQRLTLAVVPVTLPVTVSPIDGAPVIAL